MTNSRMTKDESIPECQRKSASRRKNFGIRSFVIPSSFVIRHSSFREQRDAFTLIELLTVMAIIIVLAGLILATAIYVQKKGLRSRAEAEIAAMSAALENYKADNGVYPKGPASDSLDAKTATNPISYQAASAELYSQLTGDADYDDSTDSSARSYMTFKPNMKSLPDPANPAGPANKTFARDPFGNSYGYSTAGSYNPTFDLWSTANETDSARWIKNW